MLDLQRNHPMTEVDWQRLTFRLDLGRNHPTNEMDSSCWSEMDLSRFGFYLNPSKLDLIQSEVDLNRSEVNLNPSKLDPTQSEVDLNRSEVDLKGLKPPLDLQRIHPIKMDLEL